MTENCNGGVCCNVCECKHNEKGCNCELDKIEVSKGMTETRHFCKSYECKDNKCKK